MSMPVRHLTLEEFLRLPEEEPALEYFEGEVTQKVSPNRIHARLEFKLADFINRFAEPIRLAVAFPELRATFGRASLVPDLAVYRWDRIPRDPDGRLSNEVPDPRLEPPDIAIEIMSPGQSMPKLTRRCRYFLRHGTAIVLLIQPEAERIRRFTADHPDQVLTGDDRIDFDAVLPGFQLTVRELFDTLYLR